MQPSQQKTLTRIILSLIVLSGLVGYGLMNERQQSADAAILPAVAVVSTPLTNTPPPATVAATPKATPSPTPTNQASPKPAPTAPKMSSMMQYQDGTYTAVGQYEAPDGFDQIQVSVTIRNDVITAADVTSMARRRTTAEFQQAFIDSYTPNVVGKKVANLQLFSIAGASLTTEGFNNALAQIKSKAAA